MANYISELLDRLMRAEKLFRRCEQLANDPGGVDFAPLALFRHIMQMTDGIYVLAEAKSAGPMLPLLRSMLESHFSLKYIIGTGQRSKDYEKRSLAWLVFCINQEIGLKDMVNPATTRGQDFKSKLKAHCGAIGHELCSHLDQPLDSQHNSELLYERLRKSDLASLQEEYEKRERVPGYFFQLVEPKIARIEDLAREVGEWQLYKIFYRPFSPMIHGTDPRQLLEDKEGDAVGFAPLRSSDETESHVGLALWVLNESGGTIFKRYSRGV